jgi:hypothetical protein
MALGFSRGRENAANCTSVREIACGLRASTYIRAMAPILIARRKGEGDWFIEISWPNGRKELVEGFGSAAEADVEIKVRLEAFHEGQNRYDTPRAAPFERALEGRKTVS